MLAAMRPEVLLQLDASTNACQLLLQCLPGHAAARIPAQSHSKRSANRVRMYHLTVPPARLEEMAVGMHAALNEYEIRFWLHIHDDMTHVLSACTPRKPVVRGLHGNQLAQSLKRTRRLMTQHCTMLRIPHPLALRTCTL
ncbi:unnamed protein product [Ostreobium quekettii]|uniref:Uncharacterized protein n=1 Tax=Ostreobium quekettii TaxID=121088 RepID=A0A8S1J3Y1_9CHLO|nr:unnamed protein product [Ostreobium quekettii]